MGEGGKVRGGIRRCFVVVVGFSVLIMFFFWLSVGASVGLKGGGRLICWFSFFFSVVFMFFLFSFLSVIFTIYELFQPSFSVFFPFLFHVLSLLSFFFLP